MPKRVRNYVGLTTTNQYNYRKALKGVANFDDINLDFDNTGLITATGGTQFVPGDGFKYHLFLEPGTFEVLGYGDVAPHTIDFLCVAGGGAGGNSQGGGGGAGGIVEGSIPKDPTIPEYDITVGAGGATTPGSNTDGGSGGDSKIEYPGGPNYVLAKGGGGGDGGNGPGPSGGSGGGGGGANSGGNATQPTTPNPLGTNYGNAGGGPGVSPNGNGGGGAGGAGGAGFSGNNGNGGVGERFPAFPYPACFPAPIIPTFTNEPVFAPSPTSDHYGGGGGGGSRNPHGAPQKGGIGGGGRGTPGPNPTTIYPGVDYLGAGGGGGSSPEPSFSSNVGGAGGKGVVIIKYPT